MEALECISARRTALKLEGPEPGDDQVEALLRAATTAPDHRLVRPWRFVVVRGKARAVVGRAFEAAAAAQPGATPEVAARQGAKPLRAPLLIAVVASPRADAAAPRSEQLASAAAAAQNICLAATALGLGSAWKSTGLADSAPVRDVFAMVEGEELLGWIDVGHVPEAGLPRPRVEVELATVAAELGPDGLRPYLPPTASPAAPPGSSPAAPLAP